MISYVSGGLSNNNDEVLLLIEKIKTIITLSFSSFFFQARYSLILILISVHIYFN